MNGALANIDGLWDYNDPVGTERKFRELLPQAAASNDPSYHAQLLTQIARTQGLQRKFELAHETLDQVEKMLAADDVATRVRYLLERGRVLNSSKQAQLARPIFEQAWTLARSAKLDFHAIDAAHMIAIVESSAQQQLHWNEQALQLAEASPDERARAWRGSLYNNIGWTYFDQRRFDKAMEVFERAVKLREAAGKPRELRIARYCIAKTLRMQGKLEEAISINRQIIAQAEQAGEPDGYFLEELAECLLASGRAEEARPFFRRAHATLSKDASLAQQEPKRISRLEELGS